VAAFKSTPTNRFQKSLKQYKKAFMGNVRPVSSDIWWPDATLSIKILAV
jgi:hypothetical protein